MELHPDWKEFLRLLNSHGVEYLIVGAHALAFHGHPRYTADIDFFNPKRREPMPSGCTTSSANSGSEIPWMAPKTC